MGYSIYYNIPVSFGMHHSGKLLVLSFLGERGFFLGKAPSSQWAAKVRILNKSGVGLILQGNFSMGLTFL